jgi:hypothetical protein
LDAYELLVIADASPRFMVETGAISSLAFQTV